MHKRDEIIAAIKKCAERLGRAPSQAEFRRASKISWYQVYKHFRGMRQAVRAAGLVPGPRGGALDVNALTLDWAGVVRKLGTAAQPRGILRTWNPSCGNAARAHCMEPDGAQVCAAGKGVSSGAGMGGRGEDCGGEISVVGGSIQQSALSIQPEESMQLPQIGRRETQNGTGKKNRPRRTQRTQENRQRIGTHLPLMATDNTDRKAVA